jgi:tetratricopeptide (TPR) repeat protein
MPGARLFDIRSAVPRLDDLLAIAQRSKKPLPWYGLAMEYRSLGRSDDAISTFEKVHTLDPSYVAAYFMRAQVHAERGELDRARDALRAGIAAAEKANDAHAVGEMQAMLEGLA